MKKFFFTFGSNHYTSEGIPMRDFWVTVHAPGYDKARELFIDRFSSVYMDAPDKWSFQYSEKSFSPEYFPNGEYCLIEEENEITA